MNHNKSSESLTHDPDKRFGNQWALGGLQVEATVNHKLRLKILQRVQWEGSPSLSSAHESAAQVERTGRRLGGEPQDQPEVTEKPTGRRGDS